LVLAANNLHKSSYAAPCGTTRRRKGGRDGGREGGREGRRDFLLIYLYFTLFPKREMQKGINCSPLFPLFSPLLFSASPLHLCPPLLPSSPLLSSPPPPLLLLLSSVWADSAADGGLRSEFMSATILMLQKEEKRTRIKRR